MVHCCLPVSSPQSLLPWVARFDIDSTSCQNHSCHRWDRCILWWPAVSSSRLWTSAPSWFVKVSISGYFLGCTAADGCCRLWVEVSAMGERLLMWCDGHVLMVAGITGQLLRPVDSGAGREVGWQSWSSKRVGDRWVQVEDVRLLWLPEWDVGGLSIVSVVSCCVEGDFP